MEWELNDYLCLTQGTFPKSSNRQVFKLLFTAEARALLLTLDMAQRLLSNRFLVLTDSMSFLQSMRNRDMSCSLIAQVSSCIHRMLLAGGYDSYDNTTNSLENFSATLLSIAAETIPKPSKHYHRQLVTWFNDSCKSAVADRTNSLQASNKNLTNMNFSHLRVFRAEARRFNRQNKQDCWRSYVS